MILYSVKIIAAVCICVWITGQSCNSADTESTGNDSIDSIAIRKRIPDAPALSPVESMKKMHLEERLAVKLVAAEPLITAPVAMTFDHKGRIWTVEMHDYMPDTLGTGEDKPSGKVVILSDTNGDGVMDDRQVFLDSLVLPRAICLIENGILVAEPPKLWYYEIENDKPVKKTLVDDKYAEGGNVEHQPNGLLRAMNNWIYNAKSFKRYRKKGNRWLIERTHFRGQWGITQDDFGRLFYNHNSANVLGDYFMPGLGASNKNQKSVEGFNETIVADNKVYPVRPTTGINRGYLEGMLDDSLRLVNFTAACGPVIYNGDLLGGAYYGNAFVAEPSANLIKRNVLHQQGYIVTGEQAYANKEFLASEDERFRPVSLYNGPDGALYVVDMYRGIIQHKTYLTPYLKNEIKERALTKPLNCGRIYKIIPQGTNAKMTMIPDNADTLLALLQHRNGWVRSMAQQRIIDKKHTQLAPALRTLLTATNKPVSVTHALWTLEGLGELQWSDVQPLLQQNTWSIRMQALSVLPSVMDRKNVRQVIVPLREMINRKDSLAAPYIGFIIPFVRPLHPTAANQLLQSLTKEYGHNKYVADAVISNLQGREEAYYKTVQTLVPDTGFAIHKRLKKVIADIAEAKNNSKAKDLQKQFPKGAVIFQSVCATCHGKDGNGVASLAPPLNGSEWVTGDKNKLSAIVLYGLTGPVKVRDKIYTAPEINGDMPGIGQNNEFSDEYIAQLLNYIRNSWSNKGTKVTEADIRNIRNRHKGRQNPFTVDELNGVR
jgi:mono/diheme cytochrome c family protein